MKAMSPSMIARLQTAWDFAASERRKGASAEAVIASLACLHHATVSQREGGHRLRWAGVVATCAWSSTDGLLAASMRNASHRLVMENYR